MKRHKQVGISENDFRGRLNLKDRIKNPLFKQSNRLLYNFDTLL